MTAAVAIVRLFEQPTIECVRDHAEERYAATGEAQWSTLAEVCEEMIAGERDESELTTWVDQFDLWHVIGMERPCTT